MPKKGKRKPLWLVTRATAMSTRIARNTESSSLMRPESDGGGSGRLSMGTTGAFVLFAVDACCSSGLASPRRKMFPAGSLPFLFCWSNFVPSTPVIPPPSAPNASQVCLRIIFAFI